MLLVILAIIASETAATWPLDSVIARGDSSIDLVWVPESANTRSAWYAQCCPGDSNYSHCDFTPGQSYTGEAYSYGGEDPYYLFRSRLARGDLAGSHDCHWNNCGDPSPVVTGTDCSGFVCFAWNVGRESTGGMAVNHNYAHIPFDSIRDGDALVKSGSHTVLVVDASEYPDLLIYESYGWPVNGCRQRVVTVTSATWAGYIAIRNPAIASEIAAGQNANAGVRPLSGAEADSRLFDLAGRSVRGRLLKRGNAAQSVLIVHADGTRSLGRIVR